MRRALVEGKTDYRRKICSHKTFVMLMNSVVAKKYNERGQNGFSSRKVVRDEPDEVVLTKPGGKETCPVRKGFLLAGLI